MASIVAATLVLSVALLTVRCMKRASAASRHAVLMGALAAVALVSIVNVVVPPVRLGLLPVQYVATSGPFQARGAVDGPPARGIMPATDVAARTDVDGRRIGATEALGAIWWGGAVVWVLLGAQGRWRFRRLAHQAVAASNARVLQRMHGWAQRLRIRRPITVRFTEANLAPATWGTLAPTLLLPASAISWSDVRLDIVLLHELGHIARRDARHHTIAQLAIACQWFNPLVWIAARRARLERERACDDIVLAHGAQATTYAGELLALLESCRSAPRLAVRMADATHIEQRVHAILTSTLNRRARSRASAALAALLVVAVPPLSLCRVEATTSVLPLAIRPAQPVLAPSGAIASIPVSVLQPVARATAEVTGYLWTVGGFPIADGDVQLRDAATGDVIASRRTNLLGEFHFDEVPTGRYVIEHVTGAAGRVAAAGAPFSLGPGETVATFVRRGPSSADEPDDEMTGTQARECVEVQKRPVAVCISDHARCVTMTRTVPARSGEFTAWLPDQAAAGWLQDSSVWSPTHVPPLAGMFPEPMPIEIKATRLDASEADRSYTSAVWSTRGSDGVLPRFFYRLEVPPITGRWRLVATAGPNWGCFLYGTGVTPGR